MVVIAQLMQIPLLCPQVGALATGIEPGTMGAAGPARNNLTRRNYLRSEEVDTRGKVL